MGLAGALLVFAGFWRSMEWVVSGRNRDTLRLMPVGLVYLVLGYLIVTLQYLPWVAWTALPVTAAGMLAALAMRDTADMNAWVVWALIVIDAATIVSLLAALLV